MQYLDLSKTIKVLTGIAAAFVAGAAVAGSPMPVYEEPVPVYYPEPVDEEFEGFYAGVTGGFMTGDIIDDPDGLNIASPFTATTYGLFGGYNVQTPSDFVFGGELVAQMGSGTIPAFAPSGFDINYLVDARLRAGYALGSAMVYGAGGLSTTKATWPQGGVLTDTFTGWNLGAGAEVNVSGDFFVGGEYVYRNMDTNVSNIIGFGAPAAVRSHAFQLRAGLRF